MKDKYNELFNGALEAERQDRSTAIIGDKDYLFCEIDGGLCHEDGKELQRATYIANATNNFADMYEHIEEDIEILQRQAKQHVLGSYELRAINLRIETKQKLLKRARGE